MSTSVRGLPATRRHLIEVVLIAAAIAGLVAILMATNAFGPHDSASGEGAREQKSTQSAALSGVGPTR
ncbi:MAG TPA: hypothetical protein PLZ93_10960 [Nocardioides sp.]|uniref:hypothetical protein n=1 Tax=uncultured Nocardioides sp. TaxID=198441 RepID=UPI00262BFA14|nr:hypothetical protein [uncultured Nocardioides sp.]HRD61880.1 hypothetical protein [Nocardioides sp.]HRI96125.1 hypothetical protein [Nocardioides sp.]HRK45444.1 hypothetical protein [Nocardioides sp.]